MHVFCDESGGTGRDDSVFLVAAVSLTAGEATRVMKSFRKATGLRGEVKGSRLTDKERKLFFEVLKKNSVPPVSVVYCSGLETLGNWALGTLDGPDLWAELIVESTLWLGTGSTIAISVDQRYQGPKARRVQTAISMAVANRAGANRIMVQFVDSQMSDGVQIADVVANTAYREITSFGAQPRFRGLADAGAMVIRPLELKTRRPHWLEPLPA
ncbi:DUF3800 domain-containing protein [Azospirillum sp. sgz302134]